MGRLAIPAGGRLLLLVKQALLLAHDGLGHAGHGAHAGGAVAGHIDGLR